MACRAADFEAEDQRVDEFLKRANGGDRGAAVELVQHFEADFRAVVRQHLQPRVRGLEDSGDILQELCVRILEGKIHRLEVFATRADFVRYMTVVVRRWTLERNRFFQAKLRDVSRVTQMRLDNLIDPNTDPAGAAATLEHWHQTLAQLPWLIRYICTQLIDGKSLNEIDDWLVANPDVDISAG